MIQEGTDARIHLWSKIGGSAGIDLDAVCDDAAHIVAAGGALVLVHGGSARNERDRRGAGPSRRSL